MDDVSSKKQKDLLVGLILNGGYAIIGFVFGLITGSLALITDAIHNLTDNITLGISYIAERLSRREADEKKTFGYGRITILAALLNAIFMIVLAILIIVEAMGRLKNPSAVPGGIVAAVASVGIFVNLYSAYRLYKNREDLNIRSAYIDQLFDAISSLGTVIAGILMMITGFMGFDAIVAIIISMLLIFNSFKIVFEAVSILLEGVPDDINIEDVENTILNIKYVEHVDDVHIWSVRTSYNVLSCHVVLSVNDIDSTRRIIKKIKIALLKDYNIKHSTIEVEQISEIKEIDHDTDQ